VITPLAVFEARPSIGGLRSWWKGRSTLDEIAPGLFIGGCPKLSGPITEALTRLRIDHIVSTTRSTPKPIIGVTVRHVPLWDADLPTSLDAIFAAASDVTQRLLQGGRVYIHCGHGLDRCALVAALVLRELDPSLDGPATVAIIRSRRGSEALHNRRFARYLAGLRPLADLSLPATERAPAAALAHQAQAGASLRDGLRPGGSPRGDDDRPRTAAGLIRPRW
jgi:hypothetical protein